MFTRRPSGRSFQVDLLAALAEAGFGEAQTYARMTTPSEPFDAEKSGDLVIVAKKNSG